MEKTFTREEAKKILGGGGKFSNWQLNARLKKLGVYKLYMGADALIPESVLRRMQGMAGSVEAETTESPDVKEARERQEIAVFNRQKAEAELGEKMAKANIATIEDIPKLHAEAQAIKQKAESVAEATKSERIEWETEEADRERVRMEHRRELEEVGKLRKLSAEVGEQMAELNRKKAIEFTAPINILIETARGFQEVVREDTILTDGEGGEDIGSCCNEGSFYEARDLRPKACTELKRAIVGWDKQDKVTQLVLGVIRTCSFNPPERAGYMVGVDWLQEHEVKVILKDIINPLLEAISLKIGRPLALVEKVVSEKALKLKGGESE